MFIDIDTSPDLRFNFVLQRTKEDCGQFGPIVLFHSKQVFRRHKELEQNCLRIFYS